MLESIIKTFFPLSYDLFFGGKFFNYFGKLDSVLKGFAQNHCSLQLFCAVALLHDFG